MSRTLDATMVTALQSQAQEVVWFFQFEFSGGTTRYCTAQHDISWNALTWTGIGGTLTLDTVEESPDQKAGVSVTLDGVDTSIIAIVLGQNYIGRQATLYYGLVDTSGNVVTDPIQFGPYFMLSPWITREVRSANGPATATVRTRLTSRLAPLEKVKGIVTNVRSHEKHYSGDVFFEHIPNLVGKQVVWGGQVTKLGGGFTGGNGGDEPKREGDTQL